MFSKLAYAIHKEMGKKLRISVNIYCRLPKPGMGTHFFKIILCYDEKCEIKICISVNSYHRLLKLGVRTHFLQN